MPGENRNWRIEKRTPRGRGEPRPYKGVEVVRLIVAGAGGVGGGVGAFEEGG